MSLNALSKVVGKKRKRVGRGSGSGVGKTCGHGVKGQKARSGVSIKGFEGGQQPLQRRLPKRGFVSLNKEKYVVLSLNLIKSFVDNGFLKSGSVVDGKFLVSKGIMKKQTAKVKILAGNGDVKKLDVKLDFRVAACSKSAMKILEESGSKVNLI